MKNFGVKIIGGCIIGLCFLVFYHKLTVVPNGDGTNRKLHETQKQLFLISSWLREIPISNCTRSAYSNQCSGLTQELKMILEENNLHAVSSVLAQGDAWGRPFNAAIVTKNGTCSAHMFAGYQGNLVIWSSGENGINEWGANDDVVEVGFRLDYR